MIDKIKEEENRWWNELGSAHVADIQKEIIRLKRALFECAMYSGEDTSDGAPTEPTIDVWTVRAVKNLREEYDDCLCEIPLAVKTADQELRKLAKDKSSDTLEDNDLLNYTTGNIELGEMDEPN